MTGCAAVALSVELRHLAPLRSWEPVAERVLAVSGALAGGEGVSSFEVARIRSWSRRWRRLDPVLRSFYSERAPVDETVSRALRWLLDHEEGARPYPSLRWGLDDAFEAWSGRAPSHDLLPRLDLNR